MKFSFLGFNDQSQPLAEAILAHRDHQLVTVYAPDQSFPADKFPGVRQEPEWEAILHNSESELVVISPLDDMDAQEDRLRRVVQCELPTIAVQPFCSVLAAFEMEMIQAQTAAPLVCYSPADFQPLSADLATWLSDPTASPVGRIWQIAIHSNPRSIDRNSVLKQLAYDVTVVRNIAGRINQVSAVTNSSQQDRFENLSVTFTTESPALFGWYLDQSLPSPGCELRLAGADGDRIISLSQHHACWNPKGSSCPEASAAAEAFLQTLPDRLGHASTDRSWVNWCTDLDIAETVPTSLRRRRTIDILDEQRTEEGSFKGVMSIGGCALLLATLFILLGGTIIEGFRFPAKKNSYSFAESNEKLGPDSTDRGRSLWIRLWPVYPFAIFLLLQLLRFVIQPQGGKPAAISPPANATRGPPA